MPKTLNEPIMLYDGYEDAELIARCETFYQYACGMQYPDPLGVSISQETHDMLTDLINEGLLTPWEALRTHNHEYQFNDMGREFIVFPEADTLPDRLLQLYPDRKELHRRCVAELPVKAI